MKSLIVYATKYGCVEKAVNILKSKFEGEVTTVNITKDKGPNLKQYDTIILGGSIYYGKLHKSITEYVKTNKELLFKKRVGLFICAGHPDMSVRIKELEEVFPAELSNHAIVKEDFGYEINYEKLNFLDKFIFRKISGTSENHSYLSEDKIISFANKLFEQG